MDAEAVTDLQKHPPSSDQWSASLASTSAAVVIDALDSCIFTDMTSSRKLTSQS